MQPIIYSSQDAGAPQIFRSAGDINTAIKACLITGYGTKSAAGWELLSEDLVAHTLTVRSKNPKSIKSVFVIKDSDINTGPTISGYLGWDEANSKPISKYGERNGVLNRNTDSRPASNAQKWIIAADDKFCWFWLASNDAGSYGITQAFGDMLDIRGLGVASGVIGYTSTVYSASSTNINSFTSSAGTAFLAQPPYKTAYTSALGDKADEVEKYISDYYVLSNKVVYITNSSGNKDPAYFVPGLLMSAAEIPYQAPSANGTRRLDIGGGLTNPVLLLRQSYQGYIPISMDDWG